MQKRTFAEQVLWFLITATIILVPLLGWKHRIFPFTTSKTFFFEGMVQLALLVWIYLLTVDARYRPVKRQWLPLLPLMLLLAVLTVSGAISPNPNVSFWASFERGTGLVYFYHVFTFILIVVAAIRAGGMRAAKTLLSALFWSGVPLALSTFIGKGGIDLHSKILDRAGDGLIGNSSYAGAYLLMCLFVGAILWWNSGKGMRRIWISFGMLVIVICPTFFSFQHLIGQARAAAGSVAVGALVVGAVLLITTRKQSVKLAARSIGWLLLVGVLVGGGVAGTMVLNPSSSLHQKLTTLDFNARFNFWKEARMGIAERPILGWGPENFQIVFSKYFIPAQLNAENNVETWVDRPHNAVLEFFVNGGVIGGSLYIILLFTFFALPIIGYRRGVLNRIEFAGFEGLFTGWLLQNMIAFDTVSSYMFLFALYALLIGVLVQYDSAESPSLKPANDGLFFAGLSLLLLIPAWIICVQNPAMKSKRIFNLTETPSGQRDFSVIADRSPVGNGKDVGFEVYYVFTEVRKHFAQIKADPAIRDAAHADIMGALAQESKVSAAAASDYRLWYSYTQLTAIDITMRGDYENKDEIEQAQRYAAKAVALSPTDPRIYWIIAQLDAYQGKIDEARATYLKARALNPQVVASHLYLVNFEKVFGTPKTLKEVKDVARQYNMPVDQW